jgi:hypothetical protein
VALRIARVEGADGTVHYGEWEQQEEGWNQTVRAGGGAAGGAAGGAPGSGGRLGSPQPRLRLRLLHEDDQADGPFGRRRLSADPPRYLQPAGYSPGRGESVAPTVRRVLAPVRPPAVIGIGLNYAAHAHAANFSFPTRY